MLSSALKKSRALINFERFCDIGQFDCKRLYNFDKIGVLWQLCCAIAMDKSAIWW